jgi:hypothetical protein
VEVVRELGVEKQPSWRVPGLRDENHFLQARPTTPTPAEWDHEVEGDVFHCRWVPLTADTQVYGKHGAFLHALVRMASEPATPFGGTGTPWSKG